MRKRTETGGIAGMPNNLITIEQCDLQRTITLNDKRKLYYIEPFAKEELVTDNDKPATKSKPVATSNNAVTQKGGTVTMTYNITDTGERKNMYGFTARHIWTTQKIKPSADACMKDSMLMKTDGWYIDLPQFNCPVRYSANNTGGLGVLDCQDRYVTKMTGKGKLGFPLIEKRIMIMGAQTSQFEMNLETLEFSTAKLDSMLFEIPPGYTIVNNLMELQDKIDAAGIAALNSDKEEIEIKKQLNTQETKRAGVLRIGVLQPDSKDGLSASELRAHLVNTLSGNKVEAVAVGSAEEAKKYNCDLILTSTISQVKPATKLGGVLKAVRNIDPTSASAYNIESQLTLSNISDGSVRSQKNVSGKFEGTAEGAAKKALEEGGRLLLQELK
jgi:hypothetical protein